MVVIVALPLVGAACGLAGDRAFPIGCSHFVTTLRTSQFSYAPGQTVIITVTEANAGPGCTIPPQPCGPAQAAASVYGPAGQDVWDYGATRTTFLGVSTCPGPGAAGWPALYSATQVLHWQQDECSRWPGWPGHVTSHVNPSCPGTRIPSGTYRITGDFYWSDGRTGGQGPLASATITITGTAARKRVG